MTLTDQNITAVLKENSFKAGDTVVMTVMKAPPDSVTFEIYPGVQKPDGTPVSVEEIPEDWSFGNGVTCCGFSLKDGTDVSAVIVVTDRAFDSVVQQKLANNTELLEQ